MGGESQYENGWEKVDARKAQRRRAESEATLRRFAADKAFSNPALVDLAALLLRTETGGRDPAEVWRLIDAVDPEITELVADVEYARECFARDVRCRIYNEGDVIFEEADPSDGYYRIIHGSVEVMKEMGMTDEEHRKAQQFLREQRQDDKHGVRVSILQEGTGFGELSYAMDKESRRSASIRTLELSVVLMSSPQCFVRFMQLSLNSELHHKMDAISACILFRHMSDSRKFDLAQRVRQLRPISAGKFVVNQGDPFTGLILIKTGEVSICTTMVAAAASSAMGGFAGGGMSPRGIGAPASPRAHQGSLELAQLSRDEVLGACEVAEKARCFTRSAQALLNPVDALLVPLEALDTFVAQDALAMTLLSALADNRRKWENLRLTQAANLEGVRIKLTQRTMRMSSYTTSSLEGLAQSHGSFGVARAKKPPKKVDKRHMVARRTTSNHSGEMTSHRRLPFFHKDIGGDSLEDDHPTSHVDDGGLSSSDGGLSSSKRVAAALHDLEDILRMQDLAYDGGQQGAGGTPQWGNHSTNSTNNTTTNNNNNNNNNDNNNNNSNHNHNHNHPSSSQDEGTKRAVEYGPAILAAHQAWLKDKADPATGKVEVLVVDDSKSTRALLAHKFKKQNCAVTQAENGQVALDLMQQKMFALVVMDVEMPVLDGVHAVVLLRIFEGEERPGQSQPVVLLTGLDPSGLLLQRAFCLSSIIIRYKSAKLEEVRDLMLQCFAIADKSDADLDDAAAAAAAEEGSVPPWPTDHEEEPADIVVHPEVLMDRWLKRRNANVSCDVLLVDDSKVLRNMLTRNFEKQQCRTEACDNGEAALAKMKRKVYALVVMDVEMPILNGVQALDELRAWEADHRPEDRQPVALITGLEATELLTPRMRQAIAQMPVVVRHKSAKLPAFRTLLEECFRPKHAGPNNHHAADGSPRTPTMPPQTPETPTHRLTTHQIRMSLAIEAVRSHDALANNGETTPGSPAQTKKNSTSRLSLRRKHHHHHHHHHHQGTPTAVPGLLSPKSTAAQRSVDETLDEGPLASLALTEADLDKGVTPPTTTKSRLRLYQKVPVQPLNTRVRTMLLGLQKPPPTKRVEKQLESLQQQRDRLANRRLNRGAAFQEMCLERRAAALIAAAAETDPRTHRGTTADTIDLAVPLRSSVYMSRDAAKSQAGGTRTPGIVAAPTQPASTRQQRRPKTTSGARGLTRI